MPCVDNHATQLPSTLLALAISALFIIIPILLSLKLRHQKARKDEPRLPPGPWRLPVIGSLHHLLLTKNPRLVHRTLAGLARRCNAPVMFLRLGELPVVVVSSPEGAVEVMRTHDVVFATHAMSLTIRASSVGRVGLVFSPYGDRWRRLRKICTVDLLCARRVLSFRPIRQDEAARLVAAVAASPPGEPVNISKAIADYVADTTLRAIMGERFEWRDEFLEVLDKAVKRMSGFSAGDLFPSSRLACTVDGTVREVTALSEKMFEMVGRAIDQYQESKVAGDAGAHGGGKECLLDALLRIQKEGDSDKALSMTTIKAVILDMFAAGTESTATTLQWAMSELMKNIKVMQKAQREVRFLMQGKSQLTEEDLIGIKYLKNVIKETLRFHHPGPLLMPRECREPCNILGYNVPKETIVFVNMWAISRDPNYWEDAEEFKPERFEETTMDFKGTNFELIPFGAGRRMCPGIMFANAKIELALAMLLYHFDWQLPPHLTSDKMDMDEELGLTLKRKRDLYLHPILRVPPEATN